MIFKFGGERREGLGDGEGLTKGGGLLRFSFGGGTGGNNGGGYGDGGFDGGVGFRGGGKGEGGIDGGAKGGSGGGGLQKLIGNPLITYAQGPAGVGCGIGGGGLLLMRFRRLLPPSRSLARSRI